MGCNSSSVKIDPNKSVVPDGGMTGSPTPETKEQKLDAQNRAKALQIKDAREKRAKLAECKDRALRRAILDVYKDLKLTEEDKKELSMDPSGWTNPSLYEAHMDEVWEHYCTRTDTDQEGKISRAGLQSLASDCVDQFAKQIEARIKMNNKGMSADKLKLEFNMHLSDYLPGANLTIAKANVTTYFVQELAKDKSDQVSKVMFLWHFDKGVVASVVCLHFIAAYKAMFTLEQSVRKSDLLKRLVKGDGNLTSGKKKKKKKDSGKKKDEGNGSEQKTMVEPKSPDPSTPGTGSAPGKRKFKTKKASKSPQMDNRTITVAPASEQPAPAASPPPAS